ncbi:hypothetical protein ACFQH6_05930 [Halobacteriaceae archaeon GCM10025711]
MRVDLTTADDGVLSESADEPMVIQVTNEPTEVDVNGTSEASAGSYDQLWSFDSGGHPNLDPEEYTATEVLGGPIEVEVRYGEDAVSFTFALPAPFTAGSQDNVPLLIDKGDSGTGNYQFIYHASNGTSMQKNTGGGWTEKPMMDGASVDINDAMDRVSITIPRSVLETGGDAYRVGFRVSYAGSDAIDTSVYPDGTNFAVYNVPRSAFRDDSGGYFGVNGTSSKYYMRDTLE